MKKLIVAIVFFLAAINQMACAEINRSNIGGFQGKNLPLSVLREAAKPENKYSSEVAEACAKATERGEVAYLQETREGVKCIMRNSTLVTGQSPASMDILQEGVFENVGDREIEITVKDEFGTIVSSFSLQRRPYNFASLKPNAPTPWVKRLSLLPGRYTYKAAYAKSNDRPLISTFDVDIMPCPDCHTSNGGKVDFRVAVR